MLSYPESPREPVKAATQISSARRWLDTKIGVLDVVKVCVYILYIFIYTYILYIVLCASITYQYMIRYLYIIYTIHHIYISLYMHRVLEAPSSNYYTKLHLSMCRGLKIGFSGASFPSFN